MSKVCDSAQAAQVQRLCEGWERIADALMSAVEEDEENFTTSGNGRGQHEQPRAEPIVTTVTHKIESSCCCIA